MEDMVLRWISTLGFPIFAAMALAWALLKIFAKYEESAKEAKDIALKFHDQAAQTITTVNSTLEKTANALEKNATATDSNTEVLKKFGSDPMGLCKASDALEHAKKCMMDAGKTCPSDDKITMILAKITERAEK